MFLFLYLTTTTRQYSLDLTTSSSCFPISFSLFLYGKTPFESCLHLLFSMYPLCFYLEPILIRLWNQPLALKLFFSWSSALLKSGRHLLVLFLFACSVAFDAVVYSLLFPLFQHTTRTWDSYSTSGYCLSISFASSFSSHQCLKFEVSYGLILGLLLSLCTTFW